MKNHIVYFWQVMLSLYTSYHILSYHIWQGERSSHDARAASALQAYRSSTYCSYRIENKILTVTTQDRARDINRKESNKRSPDQSGAGQGVLTLSPVGTNEEFLTLSENILRIFGGTLVIVRGGKKFMIDESKQKLYQVMQES